MTQNDLRRAIHDNPTDWARMLVYADWLEENGAPSDQAITYCYRWMGHRHHYPDQAIIDEHDALDRGLQSETVIWLWWSEEDTGGADPSDLPSVLYQEIASRSQLMRPSHLTADEAIQALSDALSHIRKISSLTDK